MQPAGRRAPSPGREWPCACALLCPSPRGAGYADGPPSLLVSLQSSVLFARNANWITCVAAKRLDQVGQGQDADASQAELRRDLLDRGLAALTALLPIQRQRHSRGRCACGADDVHRLADGRARCDHVIDDDDATLEGTSDDVAAFAVILGFLAVEGPGHVAMVVLAQRDGRRRRERNALVGRAEQHVVLEARARERRRVTLTEHRDRLAVVEEAGVEEIRTLPA